MQNTYFFLSSWVLLSILISMCGSCPAFSVVQKASSSYISVSTYYGGCMRCCCLLKLRLFAHLSKVNQSDLPSAFTSWKDLVFPKLQAYWVPLKGEWWYSFHIYNCVTCINDQMMNSATEQEPTNRHCTYFLSLSGGDHAWVSMAWTQQPCSPQSTESCPGTSLSSVASLCTFQVSVHPFPQGLHSENMTPTF